MEENLIKVTNIIQLLDIDQSQAGLVTSLSYKEQKRMLYEDDFSKICNKLGQYIKTTNLKLKFRKGLTVFSKTGFKDVMLNLINLSSFSISFGQYAFYTPEIIDEIAEGIQNIKQNFSRLSFDFSNNVCLTDQFTSNLLKQMQESYNLTSLKLNFGCCDCLSANIVILVTNSLQNKLNLTKLHLSFCQIQSISTLYELPKVLGDLILLKDFSISLRGLYNLKEKDIIELIKSIKNLINLNKLKIDICKCLNVNESTISLLGNCLKSHKFLNSLHLDIGSLSIISARDFGECFKQLFNLKELTLFASLNNKLESGIIGYYFGQMKHLEKLIFSLKETKVKSQDFLDFIKDLPQLQNLKYLQINLEGCENIGSKEILEFCYQLKELNNLASLFINCDSTNLDFLHSLLDSIRQLKKLIQLRVDGEKAYFNNNQVLQKFKKVKYLVSLDLFKKDDEYEFEYFNDYDEDFLNNSIDYY